MIGIYVFTLYCHGIYYFKMGVGEGVAGCSGAVLELK